MNGCANIRASVNSSQSIALMRTRSSLLITTVAASCLPFAFSATLRSVDVTREGRRYFLVADTHLDASAAAIYDVLLDYDDDRYGRISDIYKESAYLEPDADGTPLVYTLVEGCLVVFCRSMRRVERLEVIEPRFIRTTTLPDRSDFKYARSEWVLEAEGQGTKVTYRLTMEPDFWLPPFVGPWFLKRTLARGGVDAVDRIEDLARSQHTPASAARN